MSYLCVYLCEYQCSQTCGAGVMERRVECVTSKGHLSKHCRPSERPESQAACQDRECESNSFLLFSFLHVVLTTNQECVQ